MEKEKKYYCHRCRLIISPNIIEIRKDNLILLSRPRCSHCEAITYEIKEERRKSIGDEVRWCPYCKKYTGTKVIGDEEYKCLTCMKIHLGRLTSNDRPRPLAPSWKRNWRGK